MNKYSKIYLDKLASINFGASYEDGKPSLLAILMEKIRMKSLPDRLQTVVPSALVGAGLGGVGSSLIEASKSDELQERDKMEGKSPSKNIINSILGGALTGATGGVMYTAGRDSTLL